MCCAACSAGLPATASCWASTSPSCIRSWIPSSTRTRASIQDLREKQDYITKVVRTEEENFAKTIDGGMKIFADLLAEHKAKGETQFSGKDAFKLYDTYGFPVDLTEEMVAGRGHDPGPRRLRRGDGGPARPRPEGPRGPGRPGLVRRGVRQGDPRHRLRAATTRPRSPAQKWSRSWRRTSWWTRSSPAWRPSWSWTPPPSTPRWAARWPTTAPSPPRA